MRGFKTFFYDPAMGLIAVAQVAVAAIAVSIAACRPVMRLPERKHTFGRSAMHLLVHGRRSAPLAC